MNVKNVLALLQAYLSGVLYHDLFFSEFVDLIAGKGFESKLFKLFSSRLKVLDSHGVQVSNIKEFENIGGGLYSMHLAGSGFNIRILFSFLPNAQPVLLLAFYEREGKRNTEYSSYLDPARTRLAEMKEDYEHGRI